jgi:hypothetical protein
LLATRSSAAQEPDKIYVHPFSRFQPSSFPPSAKERWNPPLVKYDQAARQTSKGSEEEGQQRTRVREISIYFDFVAFYVTAHNRKLRKVPWEFFKL